MKYTLILISLLMSTQILARNKSFNISYKIKRYNKYTSRYHHIVKKYNLKRAKRSSSIQRCSDSLRVALDTSNHKYMNDSLFRETIVGKKVILTSNGQKAIATTQLINNKVCSLGELLYTNYRNSFSRKKIKFTLVLKNKNKEIAQIPFIAKNSKRIMDHYIKYHFNIRSSFIFDSAEIFIGNKVLSWNKTYEDQHSFLNFVQESTLVGQPD